MANFFDSIKAAFAPNPELKKAKDAAKAAQVQEKQTAEALKLKQQKPAAEFSPSNIFKDVIAKVDPKNLKLNLPEPPKPVVLTPEEKAAKLEQSKNFFTKEIPALAKTIARAPFRSATSLGISAANVRARAEGVQEIDELKPESGFEKLLLGDKPIGGIGKEGEKTLAGFGVPEKTAKSPFLSIPVGAIFAGLDIVPIPGAGSLDDVAKIIAKTDDVVKIEKTLRDTLKIAEGVEDARVAELAKRLAPVTDAKLVKQEIEAVSGAGKAATAAKVDEVSPAAKPAVIEPKVAPVAAKVVEEAAPAARVVEAAAPAAKVADEAGSVFSKIEPDSVNRINETIDAKLLPPNLKKFASNVVESDAGNKAVLAELPTSLFKNTKFETLNQSRRSFKPGRKITDPIRVDYDIATGEYQITDGANRTTQALVNKDKTIPAIVDFYDSSDDYKAVFGQAPFRGGEAVAAEKVAATGAKERKFGTAVKESPESAPELKAEMKTRDLTYQPLANKKIIDAADARVAKSTDEAMAYISAGKEADAEQVATSIQLIRKFQAEGKFAAAADAAEVIAEKLTRAGQTVQAAKLYAHLKPEAILIKAQQLIKKLNSRKFRWQKDIELGDDMVKQIGDLAEQMNKTTDQVLKVELAEQLQSLLSKIPRPSVLRKLSMLQTLAQLLNPKTVLMRNPLGNEVFYRLERINKWMTSPVDWARSALTGGERSVTFRTINQGEYWKNWLQGLKSGWKGVSPGGLGTQFEIYAPAFTSKSNPATWLEKALGASLKSFDYASYKRAFNQTTGELGWLRAYNEGKRGKELTETAKFYAKNMTDEAMQIADDYGKYITFQDDNVISRGLSATKRGFNVGKEFGLGDLILKYPRTPGALLMRALEYSPAGFMRSIYLMAKPLFKGGKFNNREIELALARAITGSAGLTGLGYYLADKGIITGKPDENKRVTGIQQATGTGRYQINLSALKRWILSGFKDTKIEEGDTLYSYDWAQPVAVSLSLGANINEAEKKAAQKSEDRGPLSGAPGTFEASVSGAVQTITEQPLLSGIQRLFGSRNAVDSTLDIIETLPQSFTPTILNQIRQIGDPTSREIYDTTKLKRTVNRVKSRIPGLSDELPARYDVFGDKQKVMENPNLFNIFLNPGFVSTYKPTPAAQLVMDIYNESGETKQLPKVAPRDLTFQGKKVQLSGEQVSAFQKAIGKATEVAFSALASNDGFQRMPNSQKAQALDYLLSKIYQKQQYLILTAEQRKSLVESMDDAEKQKFAESLAGALK